MGNTIIDNLMQDRLPDAAGPATLIHGPAGCGKTTLVLDLYRQCISPQGRPACMIIAPSAVAARSLTNRLLKSSSQGVLVSPNVTTFDSLASRILAHAQPGGKMISPFWRHMLLRRIVDDLARERQLTELSAVADTQGLVPVLDEVISELKRAATDPLGLTHAAATEGKTGDILRIYTRYQQHLQQTNLYDVEGQLWLARDALAKTSAAGAPPMPPLADLAAVAVDGFTDFTPTQLDMLALIATLVPRMVITLPWAPDARHKMWHWTGRTLDRIRARLGDITVLPMRAQAQSVSDVTGPGQPPLPRICDTIFDYDAPPAPPPPGLSVMAAPGIDAEVAYVAVAVKRLMMAGAACGSIAILLRNPNAYRRHVERIFAKRGITVPQARQNVTDCPAVRFVLQMAGLGEEDFQAANVLAVIRNSYFCPATLGPYDAATVVAAETIIRQGNVLGGRESYAKAARRLASRARQHDDPLAYDADEPQADVARPDEYLLLQAAAMLEGLFGVAAASPSAQGLLKLIQRLRLAEVAARMGEPQMIARDLRAIAALSDMLEGVTQEWDNWPHLEHAIGCIESPAQRGEAMVDVLSVLDARPLRYEHVFILGASEGQFPGQLPENPLLGEADRSRWSAGGLALDLRGDLTAREMLLFYLAISRADKSLSISYVESGSSPSDTSAGSFVQSLLEPFGGLASAAARGLLHKISPGQLVPPVADIATPADAINAAISDVFEFNSQSAIRNPLLSLAWVAANAPTAISRVAAGLWARHRRWSQGQCDQFDGRIADTDLLAGLSRRFGGQVVFSASQIDTYNRCPWDFFARYVLGLQELDWPQKRLEPVTRGLFIHKVLFRLFVALRDNFGVAIPAMSAVVSAGEPATTNAKPQTPMPATGVKLAMIPEDVLLAQLDAGINIESAAAQVVNSPYPVLWETQLTTMRQQLREYILNRRASAPDGCASMLFELSFGAAGRSRDTQAQPADAASQSEPVSIMTPDGPIRLMGRIDRVDYLWGPWGGGTMVVDYKTGALPSAKSIRDNRRLQLPLYIEALEALTGLSSVGGSLHAVRDDLDFRYYSWLFPKESDPQALANLRLSAMARVGEIVRSIRQGKFDLAPLEECRGCEFRQICHYSKARSLIKESPGQAADAPLEKAQ